MDVQEKENITKYEVYLKIDNLNIDDTFDALRMERLLNVFRYNKIINQIQQFMCCSLLGHVENELNDRNTEY